MNRHLYAGTGLVVLCVLALGIGARRINDEGYVSTEGDMPRFLMNGVFLLDVVRDHPFESLDTLIEYSRHYYARYPALSLGHHPPLIALAEVPAFALLGVSVRSARVVVVLCFLSATIFLYLLVHRLHGTAVSLFAAALFITSPTVVMLAQSVFSEMLALALILAAAYFLIRFCEAEQRRDLVGFIVSAVLSLYAKQLAIFVFPALLFAGVGRLGIRRILRRDLLTAAAVMLLLLLPLIGFTLVMSRTNVAATLDVLRQPARSALLIAREAITQQFAMPAIVMIAVGLARAGRALVRDRDWIPLLWIVWAASALVPMVLLAPFEPARYSVYGVPALCVLAATAMAGVRGPLRRGGAIVLAIFVLGVQGRTAFSIPRILGADGYEAAARIVLNSDPGPTVLFSGDIDTGFFTFFVRKHDAERKLVVLRADKVLTTSFMALPSIEDRIQKPDEIYGILRRYGTRYVVIEDRPSVSPVLDSLWQEVRSRNFVERARIPMGTLDMRLRGTSLVVYEFLEASPPDPAAVLSIDLPVVDQSVNVKLSDLINRRFLR